MKNGMMEHHEMRAVLNNGGSITYNGHLIVHHSELPSLGELTKDDPVARRFALKELEIRHLSLLQEMRDLQDDGGKTDPLPPETEGLVEEVDDTTDEGLVPEVTKPKRVVNPSPFGVKDVTPDPDANKPGQFVVNDLPL